MRCRPERIYEEAVVRNRSPRRLEVASEPAYAASRNRGRRAPAIRQVKWKGSQDRALEPLANVPTELPCIGHFEAGRGNHQRIRNGARPCGGEPWPAEASTSGSEERLPPILHLIIAGAPSPPGPLPFWTAIARRYRPASHEEGLVKAVILRRSSHRCDHGAVSPRAAGPDQRPQPDAPHLPPRPHASGPSPR